ncbi:hypothetical protein NHF45_13615 [Maricaulaceae bacterium NA33B04]|nr:hypothetical protein [Maricaulaceae bacterium NA33B04]
MTALTDQDLLARILAKTCEYLDFPAVVGHETPFLDHLARDFTALGFKTERPKNLCVVDLGKPGPIYLAHADRHGTVIDDDGAAVYAAHAVKNDKYGEDTKPSANFVASLNTRHAGEEVFAYDRISGGRIAYGEITGAELDDNGRALIKLKDMPTLPAGTPIAFARSLERSQSGFIAGQLDNPVTLATLRIAAELGLGGKIIFTAEEEIGRSASHFLQWADSSDLGDAADLVVCDTSPFDDAAAALAGAVILRRRDATASFNADQVSRLEKAASAARAPIIFKDSFIERENDGRTKRGDVPKSMGMTELGQITAQSKGRYTGATLQLPSFDYHTNRESTTPRALIAYARSLLAL